MSIPTWGPYPHADRDETFTTTYESKQQGSVVVPDAYIALEVPPDRSAETKDFVQAQYDLTRTYLDGNPERARWLEILKKCWNYPRFSPPMRENDDHYYFEYNSGLQSHLALYRVKLGLEDTILTGSGPGAELFFDPDLLALDDTISLTGYTMSKCGKYWAYGISKHGSDWITIYVRETSSPHLPTHERGKDHGRMDDVIRHCRFWIVSWTNDSKGFFYSRYPAEQDTGGTGTDAAEHCKVYYHRLGESQDKDTLVHKDPQHPHWLWSAQLTNNGKYVLLAASRDTSHSQLVRIAKIDDNEIGTEMKWITLHDSWGARFSIIEDDDSKIYFMTNYNAKNYKVMTFDVEHPEADFTTLVEEDSDAILTAASVHAGHNLVLIYLRDARHEVYIHDLATGKRVGRIFEDLIGTISVTGQRKDDNMFVHFNGFASPGTVYRYKFHNDEDKRSLFRAMQVPGLNLDDFVSESVFYKSKDGTQIHMFITRPKDVSLDGTAPVLQYGYGGFAVSMLPSFSVTTLLFCKAYRAIYALPNIRGGSEYGEAWHEAGMLDKKQNVFDDFQAATQWLVEHKYAHKDRVAIRGGSNGGILTAACANQTPQLYRCILTIGGIFDILKFPKFTFGALWCSEYGDPNDPEAFDYIFKYSPYHNIPPEETRMPAMLFFTATYDDRVSPLHTFKHVAALQHRFSSGPNPILMRVDMKAGHYAGKSTEKMLEESADECSFIGASLGLTMDL